MAFNTISFEQYVANIGKNTSRMWPWFNLWGLGWMETLQGQSWGQIKRPRSKDPDLKSPETLIRLSRLRHAETNEGQRKIQRPRKNFRQCLKEDLKSFNIPVEDFNKIALDRKKLAQTHNWWYQNFSRFIGSRCFQASAKRHTQRIKWCWFWIYFAIF